MGQQWQRVKLGEVANPVIRAEAPISGKTYRQVGVRLWGQGAYEREPLDGAQTKYAQLFRAEGGDIIVNKIWARNGSVAVVSEVLAGCYGSSEFPMFATDRAKLDPRWVHWLTKTRAFWTLCDEKSRGTSGQNRIRPEQFLEIEIPLPPPAEQRRIVARIEELADQIHETHRIRTNAKKEQALLLAGAYRRITENAPRQPLGDIAPLTRRPIVVDPEEHYPQIAVRSFGRGTFRKPPLSGAEVTWQKPFLVKAEDILISNIKAWEGAIAVVSKDDDGRVGSHRYLTFVPKSRVATARFVCFHLLTTEGLHQVGEASPGTADRNRTLSAKTLLQIPVPLPSFEQQLWFDKVCNQMDALERLQGETTAEFDALLPAILDCAFKGAL